MSFGALLACGEGGDAFARAVAVCAAAMDAGDDVFLYLLHEGTRGVHAPRLQALRDRGMRLFCCAFGARGRGIEVDDAAVYCGMGTLADIIASVDRFASFTGARSDGGIRGPQEGGAGAKRRVVVSVCADPGTDDRPVEGIRVAAGLSASGRLDVGLILGGEARRCLESGGATAPHGAELFAQLRSFREAGGTVWEEGRGGAAGEARLRGSFAILEF